MTDEAKAPRLRGGANNRCPHCGTVTLVVATRLSQKTGKIYRERKCSKGACSKRFWTSERAVKRPPADVRSRPESNRGARRRAGKR